MSQIKKLAKAKGYSAPIPRGFEQGVSPGLIPSRELRLLGADEDAVSESARAFVVTAREAFSEAIAKGKTQKLESLAERLHRTARESRDGGVAADVAMGLMALDQPQRAALVGEAVRIGEEAGDAAAEMFLPLANAKNANEVWSVGDANDMALAKASQRAMEREADADIVTRDKLEPQQIPAVVMEREDRVGKTGAVVKGREYWKNLRPESRAQGNTRISRLKALAGDQLQQIAKIEENAGNPGLIAALQKTVAAGQSPPETPNVYLPNVRSIKDKSGFVRATPRSQTLTVGANPDPNAAWSMRNRDLSAGVVVESRNRSQSEKILEKLWRMTEPTADQNAVIDLDQMFPWWRSQFAEATPAGDFQYPNAAPTPEFITGIIRGLYLPQDANPNSGMRVATSETSRGRPDMADPDAGEIASGSAGSGPSNVVLARETNFFERVKPLIARSIAAASPQPTTPKALRFAQMKFVPGDRLKSAAAATPVTDGQFSYGAKGGLSYPTYGSQAVRRPQTAVSEMAGQVESTPLDPNGPLAKLLKARAATQQKAPAPKVDTPRKKRRQSGTGTNDTASINSVQGSVLASLIA